MSFKDVQKGANRGVVSTHGQKPAQITFIYLRYASMANYKRSTQQLGSKGLS
jgi:hypothetical protein